MTNYRLYRLDPHSSRFIGMEELQASDDASAVVEIRQRAYGNSVELWDEGRRVTRIEALADRAVFAPSVEGQPLH